MCPKVGTCNIYLGVCKSFTGLNIDQSPSVVACKSLNASSPLIIDNHGTSVSTIVHVRCEETFLLNGNDTLVCMGSGEWSSLLPTCVPKGGYM